MQQEELAWTSVICYPVSGYPVATLKALKLWLLLKVLILMTIYVVVLLLELSLLTHKSFLSTRQ